MKAFCTLLKTELKLSLRGMDMVIFAICMPLAALVLIGCIYGNAPAFEGAGYTFLQQSFGALTAISMSAGGLMGLPLVISDYRSKKILMRYQVTPISPALILLVQTCVYALYCVASLASLLIVTAVFFGYSFPGSIPAFAAGYLVVMLCIFSIGMAVGGIAPNTKTAGLIASLLYFPMLLFSGTTLPYEVMPAALQKAADILPLTHAVKILKSISLGLPIADMLGSVIILLCVAIVCIGFALRFFRWE